IHRYQASKASLAAVKLDNDTTRNQVSDEVAHDYLTCLRTDATRDAARTRDRKSTRLNSSHVEISYAVFCLKKKKKECIVDVINHAPECPYLLTESTVGIDERELDSLLWTASVTISPEPALQSER